MGAIQIVHVPGAKAANTNIDLPATYPKMAAIVGARKLALTEGAPNTIVATSLTVTAPDTLAAGQIARVDRDTYKCGDAVTASDEIELIIVPETAHHIPS